MISRWRCCYIHTSSNMVCLFTTNCDFTIVICHYHPTSPMIFLFYYLLVPYHHLSPFIILRWWLMKMDKTEADQRWYASLLQDEFAICYNQFTINHHQPAFLAELKPKSFNPIFHVYCLNKSPFTRLSSIIYFSSIYSFIITPRIAWECLRCLREDSGLKPQSLGFEPPIIPYFYLFLGFEIPFFWAKKTSKPWSSRGMLRGWRDQPGRGWTVGGGAGYFCYLQGADPMGSPSGLPWSRGSVGN